MDVSSDNGLKFGRSIQCNLKNDIMMELFKNHKNLPIFLQNKNAFCTTPPSRSWMSIQS